MKHLISEYHIMNSDEDQPIVEDLVIGFDTKFNLIVTIRHNDYENKRNNCYTSAVVPHDEGLRLARRLKVHHYMLSQHIGECMSEWDEITNPSLSQVQECFSEILECMLNEGCKYRIKQQYNGEKHRIAKRN